MGMKFFLVSASLLLGIASREAAAIGTELECRSSKPEAARGMIILGARIGHFRLDSGLAVSERLRSEPSAHDDSHCSYVGMNLSVTHVGGRNFVLEYRASEGMESVTQELFCVQTYACRF